MSCTAFTTIIPIMIGTSRVPVSEAIIVGPATMIPYISEFKIPVKIPSKIKYLIPMSQNINSTR
jgi:hypothetical protein